MQIIIYEEIKQDLIEVISHIKEQANINDNEQLIAILPLYDAMLKYLEKKVKTLDFKTGEIYDI